MNYDHILSQISQLPHTWSIDSKDITLDSYYSIIEFLKHNYTFKSTDLENNTNTPNMFYHQSIFHFLLYYAYYPKIPFIMQFQNQLIFGSIYGKNHSNLELSFPLLKDAQYSYNMLDQLMLDSSFKQLVSEVNINQILFRDAPDEFIQIHRSSTKNRFAISSVKEINYQIFDINRSLALKGKEFANLRWHLNKFKKGKHSVETVVLPKYLKAVIHLIGDWKKNAIAKRGFSFINIHSDKQAARLFSKIPKTEIEESKHNYPNISDCLFRILKIDGHISSFHFGFPLGIFQKK